jgi:hypothetical protein
MFSLEQAYRNLRKKRCAETGKFSINEFFTAVTPVGLLEKS